MQHMQDTYECRDAAHNYSDNCKKRLAELNLLGKSNGFDPVLEDIDNEPLWEFAMQKTVTNNDIPDDIDTDTFSTTSKRKEQEIMRALVAAEQGKFYASHDVVMDNTSYEALLIQEGDECDIELANVALKLLMAQKEEYLLYRKHSI